MDIKDYKKLKTEQLADMIRYNAQKIKRFQKLNQGALIKNNMFIRLKTYKPIDGFDCTGAYLTGEEFIFRNLYIEADWTEEELIEKIAEVGSRAIYSYSGSNDKRTDYDKMRQGWGIIQRNQKYKFAVLPCGHQSHYRVEAFEVFLYLKEIIMVKKIKAGVFKEVPYFFQKLDKTKILQEFTS